MREVAMHVSAHHLREISAFQAATLYEAQGKSGELGPRIRNLTPGQKVVGTAFTVRCWLGDARGLWQAIADAPRGSVIVADMGDAVEVTALGASSVLAAQVRGLAGIVVNGAVRDITEVRRLGFPVFGLGVSVRGTLKNHPGTIGKPLALGMAVVAPGDILVGDDDGLVVVRADEVEAVIRAARLQKVREDEIDERIARGEDVRDVLGFR
jgi:4-hydroxy-4-methyl-2-oxoglutarate aldolase